MRAAKVVTYCSVACANQSDTGAVVAPSEIAKPAAGSTLVAAKAIDKQPEVAAPKKASRHTSSNKEAASVKPAAREAVPKAIVRDSSIPKTKRTSGGRTKVLVACGVVMLGGIAIAVVQAVSHNGSPASHDEARKLSDTNEQSVVQTTQEQDDAKPIENNSLPGPAVMRAAAIRELESHLGSGPPRFQRLAGIALARIKHPEAVASLRALLTTEDSDLSRIDIAYGMALGGEVSGREYLVNELKSPRRDVRIDAARRLVQLGDDAGRKTLVQMLGVKSHRLGAASVLALLADEEGLEVLRHTLSEKDVSEENRMRAAVGLGRAGDESARELLLEILKDGRYVVDAAGALATLGEQQAIPALERQLELTAMRVVAAESLRAMGANVDLALIASALTNDNEEGRIAAAEAILILTPEEGDN